jgi:hypothetical protein
MDDVADMVGLYALVSCMRLVSSLDVVEAAEQIILGITFWWLSASATRRADSVMNSLYSASSLARSASLCECRICARWVAQDVENDAKPPIAAPARPEKAEIYGSTPVRLGGRVRHRGRRQS